MLISIPLIGCNRSYDVELELYSPSIGEGQYISPNRSFKVICKITKGSVPDDAIARVSLLDKNGKEIRYSETNKKAQIW